MKTISSEKKHYRKFPLNRIENENEGKHKSGLQRQQKIVIRPLNGLKYECCFI
jgi:hypothetical protein